MFYEMYVGMYVSRFLWHALEPKGLVKIFCDWCQQIRLNSELGTYKYIKKNYTQSVGFF